MTRFTMALGVVLAMGAAAGPLASVEPDALWQTEEFKKAFLGTYGVHPDVEPRIGPEDRLVLEKVYPLLGSDPAKAEVLLTEAKTPQSSAIFDFVLGNLAFQSDRLGEAEAHYREAVTRFPSFRRAWRNLGLIEAQDQRHDEAIASFTKMISLGGGDAISYGLLARAHLAKNDYLAAESAFRQALLLEPVNDQWRLGLARSVLKQEKYEEGVALLAVLLDRDPERSEFWLLQASAYLGLEQPLRAAENLEFVALLGKATPESFFMLGDIYLNENKVDLAANAYVRAIQANPTQAAAKALAAAENLSARGGLSQAAVVAGSVRGDLGAKLSPEEALRLSKLEARIAVAQGDSGEAMKVLEQALAYDPLDGEALLLVGEHYADSGDIERAKIYFERAGGIDGFEAPAKLREAQLLVAGGKYAEALPLLRRVMELKPREQVARYTEQVERLSRVQP